MSPGVALPCDIQAIYGRPAPHSIRTPSPALGLKAPGAVKAKGQQPSHL